MSAIIRSFLRRPSLMRSTILRPGASNPCRSFSSQTWTSIGLRNTVQRPSLCHMKHFKVSREVHSSSSLSATMNQAMRRPKKSPKKVRRSKPKSPYLENGPQKKGVCVALMIGKPKKPNSAKRKIARVKLTTGKTILCYVPGEGHNLQEHSVVLVRGGRAQDLPGVRYRLVRGALDFNGVVNRRTARSKYGAKKPKA